MSSRIFTILAMEDVYNISIVQQCRMLESPLTTDITNQCFSNPDDAASITHSGKKLLHEQDTELLIASAITHPSVEPVAQIAATVSGRKIWDTTLDHGVKGTRYVQTILRELS